MRIGKLVWSVAVAGCLAGVASANQIHSVSTAVPYVWEFVGADGLSLDGYSPNETLFNGHEFMSFCIEGNEYFSGGGTYYWEQTSYANNGGVNTDATDPLSVGTAWLYSQFAQGALANYTYGNSADAKALQNAIWMLEDEITWNSGNKFIALADLQGLGNLKDDASDGQFGVWALNLWGTKTVDGTYSSYKQDQLYYDGSNRVPDGGMTLAMLGTALAGLAVLRLRR